MAGTRIGVALCGAELAGTAHIGILFALEELGITPALVAGSSSGALVASMYAHGYSFAEFRRAITKFPGLRLFDYGFPLLSSLLNVARHPWQGQDIPLPQGVLRGHRLRRYIQRVHQNRLPKLPFYLVATDLNTTNAVVFTNDDHAVQKGVAQKSTDLCTEIAGSCAIPGVWTPVRHRHWMLVDGGVRDVVPVTALRQAGCDRIFAVNVHALPDAWYPVTMVDILQRSLATLLDEAIDSSDLSASNVFVLRPELNRVSWWSYRETMLENIELAYQYVLSKGQEIQSFLAFGS